MSNDAAGIRQDPTLRLSRAQEMRLWRADIMADDGVLRIDPTATPEQLSGARMLTNARVLLGALADGPVTATASLGNLPRSFVRRMLDEMSWKPVQLEGLHLSPRATYNEEDVPDLKELRVVLGLAGLLKKRKERFSLTRRGEQMLAAEQSGRLFALLLRTYFGRFNMFYGYGWRDDPEMQAHIVFSLWVIREMAGGGGATTEISGLVARDELLWGVLESQQPAWLSPRFPHVVGSVILEPLEALGLLANVPTEGVKPVSFVRDWDLATTWATTPLFATALEFELGPAEPDGAAADEAEWAAFVPAERVSAAAAFERYLTDGASPLVLDAGPDIRLLVEAWTAYLCSGAAAPRKRKRKKTAAPSLQSLSTLEAVATAPAFVESVRALERPDEPGPAMFAAAMAADFAVWCAENELIPESMAMRRADEAEQEATRLGRAVRGILARDDDAPRQADAARGMAAPAQTRPQAPRLADGQLRLVPETRAVAQEDGIARLTVTLLGTEPAVWRQIEVPAGSTFAQLHTFLNTAMGWEDVHLHSFSFGGREVGGPELNDAYGPKVEDEHDLTLADALADGHRRLLYTYDFGDDWCHDVVVEALEDAAEGVFYPRCVAGAHACPPEDVGGAPGYAVILDAMADPHHPEHADQLLWLEEVYGAGGFDPGAFDAEAVSRLLRIAATGELAADDADFFDR
ncbi:MAG: plasmid pRiA4b ORF-3 family protein [Thermoleophilia bacterium]